MPKLIDRNKRDTAIAEATWDLLIQHGIQGITIRKVAEQAGLSSGSLRHSHPTHADLLRGAITHLRKLATARLQALPQSPDPVIWGTQALAETLPLDEQRIREMSVFLVFSTAAFSSPTVKEAFMDVHGDLRRLCDHIVARLSPPAASAATLSTAPTHARRLHALLDGLALHLLHQPATADNTWATRTIQNELLRIHNLLTVSTHA